MGNWVWLAIMGVGLVFIVSGIALKPADKPVAWGWFWGFAQNSTPAGKAAFILGGFPFVLGVTFFAETAINGEEATSSTPTDTRIPYGNRLAKVVQWESSGVVEITGPCRCYFEPTWQFSEGIHWASNVWPPGTEVWASCIAPHRQKQAPGKSPLMTCMLTDTTGRSWQQVWQEADKKR